MSNQKLHKALQTQKQKTQQVEQEIYGTLGIPLGGRKLTDVPSRPSYVYVRLRDNQNEVIQAFNNRVTSSYNLPVVLHREGTRYVVDGVNTQRYQNNWNNSAAYLPRHGTNHSFYDGGGGDVTWVYSRQIMPYLVYPDSTITGTYLKISSHTLLDVNNQWKVVGGTGTPSLLQYLPTGGNDAIMGLLYIDSPTGNPKLLINSGTPFSNFLTGTGDIYQYIPVPNTNTQIPLAAIRLSSGTNNINWDNLYDVRQWIHTFPSGTSTGGSSGAGTSGFAGLANGIPIGTGTVLNVHGAAFTRSGTVFDLNITGSASGGTGISGSFIQDEGIPQGFVTTFNFVGATIDASVSGSVARIFVTGSTGGSNPPVTGSFVVQNNGTTLGSATILNFTNGVTASISGSVAQIQVTGTSTYIRTAPPISLSSVTGVYWQTQEGVFASGSLALFNQGHALIPAIDYLEQYPASGTFQYISTPPTGTYNLAIYGVPAAGGNTGGGGGGGITLDQADGAGLYHRLDTASVDDDEFAGNVINAAWTQFIAGVGTATWSQGNHALHCLYSGNAAAKLSVIGKAVTLADGEAWETLLRFAIGTSVQYPFMGLFVSNGLTATSNCLIAALYHDGTTPREWLSIGTLQAIGGASFQETPITDWTVGIRLKLYRTNSTNFGMKISTTNGYTFLTRPTAGTTYNPGFTPTHAGLFVSTYGSAETFLTSFDYFRKVSA